MNSNYLLLQATTTTILHTNTLWWRGCTYVAMVFMASAWSVGPVNQSNKITPK